MLHGQKRNKSNKVKQKSSNSKQQDVEELVLPASKLRFCPEQLQNLNFLFAKNERKLEKEAEKSLKLARSVAERLVQRLVCGIGQLDSRFASKFLVSLNEKEDENTCNLDFLVRLDALSTPGLYADEEDIKYSIWETGSEYPAGYAKLRMLPKVYKLWGEFVNSSGYLRRDKVQARFVQLLAQVAGSDCPNSPLQIDESILCGSPGKIVDAFTLNLILQSPRQEHVFFGPAGNTPRFPDPRDFRLAIVDEPTGIRIRMEFLSPALESISIDVRLILALQVDAWPLSTDFPARISLGHSDCLLYYKAAQTGMFLTSYGMHTSAWKIELPAAENFLLNHYSTTSTVRKILQCLYLCLENIHDDYHIRKEELIYKIISRTMVRSTLFYELENDFSSPMRTLLNWSPLYFSTYILKILDSFIFSLSAQELQSYFFPKMNLLVNPGYLGEEDYAVEAHKIKMFLIKQFDESLMSTENNNAFRTMLHNQEAEMMLLMKWNEIQKGLLPRCTRKRRKICFVKKKMRKNFLWSQYTGRQLEYISLLLKNMLLMKQNVILPSEDSIWLQELGTFQKASENPIEEVIYIIVTIMQQARDHSTENKHKPYFDSSTAKLVEAIRKDKAVITFDENEDVNFVKVVLKWLYKSLQDKKHTGPILRPFLNTLFVTSHAHSFYLEAIKERDRLDEIESLETFVRLVNFGEITPAQGVIDSVNKKWIWARHAIKILDQCNLRLIFIESRGKTQRHVLALPKTNENSSFEEISLNKVNKENENCNGYFNTIVKNFNRSERYNEIEPIHNVLKYGSPLNSAVQNQRRYGEHRCHGDIFETLLSMQKTNILHDIASHLPPEERANLVETIQKISTEKNKRTWNKKWSSTLPALSKSSSFVTRKVEALQKYTPKEESAGIAFDEHKNVQKWDKELILKTLEKSSGTLIGSCRAARIREDNSIQYYKETFKVKSLMRS